MKEINRKITTEQIIYEITKEELEEIKRKERNNGRDDIVGYLTFAMKYYKYEINFGGINKLVREMCSFFMKETDTIQNVYGYSFNDYIRRYG